MYAGTDKAARFFANDNIGAVFFVGTFKPARNIHRVANHRVVEAEF